MPDWQTLQEHLRQGIAPSDEQALSLADIDDTAALVDVAAVLRDRGHHNVITYSRKVFIPLTHLCRDVCHYCTFAQTPKKIEQPYMPVEDVLSLCREGAKMGCQEALFTLGEKPELRYRAARQALDDMGFATTLDYVKEVARRVLSETGLLPHINAGCMDADEIAGLRQVSASMGIMLESASERLCQKGMPHYGSPDKEPARRLQTMELAGEAAVPFTSGVLIGIGETRRERIESLLALRRVHQRYGHLQEVIIQNFRAKPDTLMAAAPEPDLNELLWTIAVARLVFGPAMNIQAPPNLSPGVLPQLVAAGINDWGGVSPLTPDYVNPEAPWPHLERLASETAAAGKFLEQRLTVYPAYASDGQRWLDKDVQPAVLRLSDAAGFARRDNWVPGEEHPVPAVDAQLLASVPESATVSADVRDIVRRCRETAQLTEEDVTRLFDSRGADFSYVVGQANALRQAVNGDTVSYVVNRNINYTNVCYFKCQFCAFSKGKQSENLRGRPYDISGEDIAARCIEAWERGATEVCMQGGIHPDYTGQTYLDIVHTVRTVTPQMHIHAFSPLEVLQGATTLGISVPVFLRQLRDAGLDTLPGTAAEILHDEVRASLCPDKLNTAQWLEVMAAAHDAGLRTTATIMYGHIDRTRHWASHLLQIRALQQRTGGFTEFVPLPFVHMEAPMYLKGKARRGPSFREAVLMHAVARLVFHGLIDNIQASWVKMGRDGVAACLNAGANDLGGSLMNESITRAAGSGHGQEWAPALVDAQIRAAGRRPRMRTTLYADASDERRESAFAAAPLAEVYSASAGKRQRNKRIAEADFLGNAPQALPLTWVQPSQDPTVYESVVLMAACN
ncbi:MAG: 5-amino-6-(D-ribitylamino)uracil--L-tyrosine 4-hydroxyphenyl transferase CofH [Halioglobus sp.]|nr:5-amino-6-(D-ribitylamino)uracil--L-tyrosine 4-hydroxyphenyl transferase CofH [Halioglobus sp.]